MSTIHSIVSATDLSAPARRAADRAAMLARAASASLTLVHTVNESALLDLRRWLDRGETAEQSILDEVRARLHDLASELGARHGIDIEESTVTGRPVDAIAKAADDRQADLIVMGNLGTRLFSHLIGSTAERVVKKSTRPVLMVRQWAHEAYRRVLVPVDFSRWSAPSLATALAVAPDAYFLLVHCVEVPFEGRLRMAGVQPDHIERHRAAARGEALKSLQELAASAGLDDTRYMPLALAGSDPPWLQIVQQEQAHDCDLTVIGKHGRNFVEELLLGSTTNVVISEGTADVLVSAHADAS